MNLKGLVHRELGEGMTEKELAEAIGVPLRTLTNILSGRNPRDHAVWDKFARYFRMDVDFLRTGESAHVRTTVELPRNAQHSAAGEIRKIPLLQWQHIGQIATSKALPAVVHAEAVVEATDVPGERTFALKVQDDSMEPLISEGEMVFVNPDLEWKPDDYVIAHSRDHNGDAVLLRQIKRMGSQWMLHPLNRKYDDLPVTNQDTVWGKIVRLRKNL
jgi:SOS-response transcriptional repressor LexA